MTILDNFTMWVSANMVITTVALGAIAIPIFGLGFWDSPRCQGSCRLSEMESGVGWGRKVDYRDEGL
ncbi:hypothetical protein HER14_01375, partial [Acidithiobacillus thiooxidans]|nr:hypothetical protein [Acidithiobacillus thiooxidans]